MQFAKMIVKTLDLEVTGSEYCPFVDVAGPDGEGSLLPLEIRSCVRHLRHHQRPERTPPTSCRTATSPASRSSAWWCGRLTASRPGHPTRRSSQAGSGQLSPTADPDHGANIKKAEYNGLLNGLEGLSSGWNAAAYASRGECAQLLYNLLVLQSGDDFHHIHHDSLPVQHYQHLRSQSFQHHYLQAGSSTSTTVVQPPQHQLHHFVTSPAARQHQFHHLDHSLSAARQH